MEMNYETTLVCEFLEAEFVPPDELAPVKDQEILFDCLMFKHGLPCPYPGAKCAFKEDVEALVGQLTRDYLRPGYPAGEG